MDRFFITTALLAFCQQSTELFALYLIDDVSIGERFTEDSGPIFRLGPCVSEPHALPLSSSKGSDALKAFLLVLNASYF